MRFLCITAILSGCTYEVRLDYARQIEAMTPPERAKVAVAAMRAPDNTEVAVRAERIRFDAEDGSGIRRAHPLRARVRAAGAWTMLAGGLVATASTIALVAEEAKGCDFCTFVILGPMVTGMAVFVVGAGVTGGARDGAEVAFD